MGEKGVPEMSALMAGRQFLVTQSYLASLYPDLGFVAPSDTLHHPSPMVPDRR